MVKKRMAMRMVTIFVALIVCGMFFPGLARGATGESTLSSDIGFAEFKELQLKEESSIPVDITNEGSAPLKLIPQFESDANCELGFKYPGSDESWIINLAPGESLTITFTYTPSNYDECGATLDILNMLDMEILATIEVTGVLPEPEEEPTTFGKIVIGDVPTGVDDRMADADNSLGDMIQECEDTAYNHGHLVRCVGLLARELCREDIISCKDRRELKRAAVIAEMRQMMRAMRTEKRSGRRSHNSKHWRWHHWPHLRHR